MNLYGTSLSILGDYNISHSINILVDNNTTYVYNNTVNIVEIIYDNSQFSKNHIYLLDKNNEPIRVYYMSKFDNKFLIGTALKQDKQSYYVDFYIFDNLNSKPIKQIIVRLICFMNYACVLYNNYIYIYDKEKYINNIAYKYEMNGNLVTSYDIIPQLDIINKCNSSGLYNCDFYITDICIKKNVKLFTENNRIIGVLDLYCTTDSRGLMYMYDEDKSRMLIQYDIFRSPINFGVKDIITAQLLNDNILVVVYDKSNPKLIVVNVEEQIIKSNLIK